MIVNCYVQDGDLCVHDTDEIIRRARVDERSQVGVFEVEIGVDLLRRRAPNLSHAEGLYDASSIGDYNAL